MEARILGEKTIRVSRWSGGVTRELWLWPEDGDYAQRRFAARVSSAAVELPESDFTPLPGVTRYITPVAGGFTLSHPDGREVTMAPYDPPYRFEGGVPTHCVGRAEDCNLMLRGAEGTMEVLDGEAPVEPGFNLYLPRESGVLEGMGQRWRLEKGEALLLRAEAGERGELLCGQVIRCHILPEDWPSRPSTTPGERKTES